MSKWLITYMSRPQAKLQLFCFPFAGGSANIYREWPHVLPPDIELITIELPGRSTRLGAPLKTHINDIIIDLEPVMLPKLVSKPSVFFGFSMGALISYELAQRLYQNHAVELKHLFVAAHRAPHIPEKEAPTYNLPSEQFQAKIATLNGTPKEVLEHEELYALIEPILRADFQICQTYDRRYQDPLPSPLTVFGSVNDPSVTRQELYEWRHTTSNSFTLKMFPGDHFFIINYTQQLIDSIVETIL